MQQSLNIYDQLEKFVKKTLKYEIKSSEDNVEDILRTIVSAFFMNIA